MTTKTAYSKPFGTLIAILSALLVLAVALPAGAESAAPAAKAFERFRALEGHWQGTNQRGDTVRLRYELVAGGSAVLEHLDVEGEEGGHDMVTMYYLDGDALMLTHYCASKNQPRMRAVSLGDGEVRFDFVDATGLESADTGHMHRAKFEFESDDHLVSSWTWRENGADAFEAVVDVRRTTTLASK